MRTIGCAFFLAVLVVTGTAFAQKLTIYTEEVAPYNFTEGNNIVGVSTEVVEAVMNKAGLDYEIISYPWARTYKLATERPNSLIFSISRRPKRETTFKWIGVIVPSRHSVFALKSRTDIKIENIDDLKKYTIGTTLDDARETYLLENGFKISDLQRVAGKTANLQNYEKLKLGRIDLWPMSEAIGYYTVRKSGDDPDRQIRKVFLFEEMSKGGYYIASSLQTSDDIVKTIRETLEKFKKTTKYQQILEKWDLDAWL
jgi:polar amino acid transport system substrate-binding protein